MKEKNLTNYLAAIALAFILGGVLGWMYEALIGLVERGSFDWEHGGIGIPFLQIYGFGMIIFEALFYNIQFKWKDAIKAFLLMMLIAAILEYTVGALMLYGFGVQTWDYRVPGWNFIFCTPDGLLCFRGIVSFGLFGLLLVYLTNAVSRFFQSKTKAFNIIVITIAGTILLWIIMQYGSGSAVMM